MIRKVFIILVIFGTFCQENTLQAQDPQFSQYYAAPFTSTQDLWGSIKKEEWGSIIEHSGQTWMQTLRPFPPTLIIILKIITVVPG